MAGTQDGQILVYGPGLQFRARLPGQGDMPLALAGNVRSGVVAAVIRGRNDSVVLGHAAARRSTARPCAWRGGRMPP